MCWDLWTSWWNFVVCFVGSFGHFATTLWLRMSTKHTQSHTTICYNITAMRIMWDIQSEYCIVTEKSQQEWNRQNYSRECGGFQVTGMQVESPLIFHIFSGISDPLAKLQLASTNDKLLYICLKQILSSDELHQSSVWRPVLCPSPGSINLNDGERAGLWNIGF